ETINARVEFVKHNGEWGLLSAYLFSSVARRCEGDEVRRQFWALKVLNVKNDIFRISHVLNSPSKAPRSAAKWRIKRGLFEERSDEFRSAPFGEHRREPEGCRSGVPFLLVTYFWARKNK
ncbi:MAG: hypothetical protein AB7U63_18135, partial [Porticoccaceae bacterium]